MPESGNVLWPDPSNPWWRFQYTLADYPDAEGIVITEAYFHGRKVLHKGSLPSLRVQYDNPTCGPWKDPLHYNNAQGNPKVKVERISEHPGVLSGVSVRSLHFVGHYRLIVRWVFWHNGEIRPQLWSAGLQCRDNHRHHAYWRLNFDCEGGHNDMVFEYNKPVHGHGSGWGWTDREAIRTKDSQLERSWKVVDAVSKRGYHIIPGPYDGLADAFSPADIFVMAYHPNEDRNGQQGDAHNDGLASYINGESVSNTDVVIWYCAHLNHLYSGGSGDEYHSCGPILIPGQ